MNDYSQVFQPDMSQFLQQQPTPVQPASQASTYPALPNSYGLGQVQPSIDQQAQQEQQKQQQMMANSSRGANPWSFSRRE